MDVHEIIFIGQEQKGLVETEVREARKKNIQNT